MIFSYINGAKELSDKYDLFLVDLWGVIHDGQNIYPLVIDCLKYLKQQQKMVIFISNAPKRSSVAKKTLDKLNITEDLYHSLITSGDITYDYIINKNHNLGSSYYIINAQEDDLLSGTIYKNVDNINKADFILSIGFKDQSSTLEEIMPILQSAVARKIPLICANPDLIIVDQKGIGWLCAGVMAKKYEELGGSVTYFGKPYHQIYETALSIANNPDKCKIAIIGDNINTDIKGGNLQNIDSYLIAGGIHAKELDIKHGQLPYKSTIEQFCRKHDVYPTGLLASFNI